jgi:hypothetical protein
MGDRAEQHALHDRGEDFHTVPSDLAGEAIEEASDIAFGERLALQDITIPGFFVVLSAGCPSSSNQPIPPGR